MKHRRMSAAPLVSLAAFSILSPAGALAADYSWKGASQVAWTTGSNWNENAAPGNNDSVITPTAFGNALLGSVGTLSLSGWDFNSATSWSVISNNASAANLNITTFTKSGSGQLLFRSSGVETGAPINFSIGSVTASGGTLSFGGRYPPNGFGKISSFTANSVNLSGDGTLVTFSVGDTTGTAYITGALTMADSSIVSVRDSSSQSGTLSVGSLVSSSSTAIVRTNINSSNGSTGTLALTNASGSATYAGILQNGGTASTLSLTKSGAGTQILTGVSTYTGSTTITAGTLAINGSGSINGTSGVTVNGGTFRYNSSVAFTKTLTFTSGTLAGTNFSGVALGIGASQSLAPGNSTGTMAAGATTFANGGTYEFELNDAAGTAGSSTAGWDLLNATSLTFTATAGQFNLKLISLTSGQIAGLAQNFNAASDYQWLFVDAGSAITSFTGSEFTINTSGFQNSIAGTFSVVRGDSSGVLGADNTQLYLVYTASVIPEPSACALLAGVVLVGYTVTRRRRSPA